jgi:hypothetical protein
MFSPRTTCPTANLALFYPDRATYTIGASSPIGWYVLYPASTVATPELLYHDGSATHYGYSTIPNTNYNAPVGAEEIRTGLCAIVWLSVEEAHNSQYQVESGIGTQMELMSFTGRIVSPKSPIGTDRSAAHPIVTEQRQVYGFYAQDRWYQPVVNPVPDLFRSSTKILARSRHVPVGRLIPNSVFGAACNITMREVSQMAAPSYQMSANVPNTATSTDWAPTAQFDPQGTRLNVYLSDPPPVDVQVSIAFGATVFDTFETEYFTEYGSDVLYIYLPAGTTTFTIDFVQPLVGTYVPELRIGHLVFPIVGWV